MSDTEVKTHENFVLPSRVVSHVDVSRLVTEIEWVDNAMTTAEVRIKAGGAETAIPALSDGLAEFLSQNQLTLAGSGDRADLIKQLRLLKDKAPIIHMTFASPADHESLAQLTKWVRESLHPQALIADGVQPALVAGVYVRTPNHVHDMSLRAVLAGQRGELVKELETLRASSN
ncbi:MAG: hypothetical protein JWO99_817 [Candidatus Saccharibacteria bacterium]|nr:hypothetical protein [Candidatus Saccharibacteria bacterium]